MQQSSDRPFETVGDFRVATEALEAAEAHMGERTNRAQKRDRRKRAPVTTDFNTWSHNTDHWDFPSVDTPRIDPRVLPKDLMQATKPRTTDPETGATKGAAVDPIGKDERELALFQSQASAADVSLAPGEALRGVGATSSRAIGGFNVAVQRETDRPGREQVPPNIARGESRPESSQDDLGFHYEEAGLQGEVEPREFKRRVRTKKREMGGLADDFAAAGLVVEDITEE